MMRFEMTQIFYDAINWDKEKNEVWFGYNYIIDKWLNTTSEELQKQV